MWVLKLDEHGREVFRYPVERVLAEGENFICIEAFFGRDDVDLGPVTFAKGDRFVEYFYRDRWYNVFAIYRAEGKFKGWYCNICRPAEWDEEIVQCDDLALDIWIKPDGALYVLDEDEFEELAISAEEKGRAWAAVEELKQLSQQQQLPR